MTRMQTAAASLVAAIPAALLASLIVLAFLSHDGSLKGLMPVVAGVTLACAASVALMPFGILVFGGKAKKKAAAVSESQATPTAVVDEDESLATSDDIETADAEADELTEEVEETVDFDSGQLSDVADTAFDEEDFFDDEPPKKMK
jgi:hypothetical protein